MSSAFDHFSSSTGIKAFVFASHAKSKIEVFFWYFLIILGTFLTCMDVVIVVQNYLCFPAGTKINLIHNATLNFGEPTLCIMITLPSVNLSTNEVSELLKNIINFDFLLDANQSGPLLNGYNDYWNLLSILVSDTVAVEESVFTQEMDIKFDSVSHLFNYSSEKSAMVSKHMHSLNISLRTVAGMVGVNFCKKYRVRAHFYNYTGENNIPSSQFELCESQYVTWFGYTPEIHDDHSLCIKLPNKMFTFASNQDFSSIKWIEPDVNEKMVKESERFGSIEFFGGPLHLQGSENVLWIPLYTGLTIGLRLTGQYQEMNHQKSPCGADLRSNCQMRCRYQFIRSKCGCQPLFDDENDGKLPICGSFNSLNSKSLAVPGFNLSNPECYQIKLSFQPDYKCASKCYPPCAYAVLASTYMPGKKTDEIGGTRVALFVETFRFHQITEIALISVRQFFSSIGGCLSLYLGASFIVLIHIVVFWLSESTKFAVLYLKSKLI